MTESPMGACGGEESECYFAVIVTFTRLSWFRVRLLTSVESESVCCRDQRRLQKNGLAAPTGMSACLRHCHCVTISWCVCVCARVCVCVCVCVHVCVCVCVC